ncbi:glycosyltransferase family 2 protein [Nocardioides endophyticus]|uniref:glycosyltransferase family 2 protein n=1 Tax=Nocardioides endophyticus TaxID=1353775 RepID=UPI0031E86236
MTDTEGPTVGGTGPIASVVIPAHDEAAVIARTLVALARGVRPDAFEVVVVCNGCTDDTAVVARTIAPLARVIEIPQPSKAEAVRVGNAAASLFPRIHLDADVELTGRDVVALVRAIDQDGLLAAGPRRVQPTAGCARTVRWYYGFWEQLPRVRSGLFGRGAFALSVEGQRRVSELPTMLNDDLGVDTVFAAGEYRIVDEAVVTVRPPRTLRDLLRRRVRVATGNTQAASLGLRAGGGVPLAEVGRTARRSPRLAAQLPIFLGVTLLARIGARRAVRAGDFTSWLRDESSRA